MEDKKQFKFMDHPWVSFWVLLILIIVSMLLSGIVIFGLIGLSQDNQYSQFTVALLGHFLMIFFIVPFVLRLPKGKRTFVEYLDDIRLLNIRSFTKLILITLTCYIILILCQSLGSVVYRLMEGKAISGDFVRSIFNIKGELPPSVSLLRTIKNISITT
ncbi:MAG: hypothetical protein ACE5JB_15475 [bacterium]